MTASRPEGAKEFVERAWVELAMRLSLNSEHCGWFKSWFATLCAEYGEEQVERADRLKAFIQRLGYGHTDWSEKTGCDKTAPECVAKCVARCENLDNLHATLFDLRAQLQTLRGENERLTRVWAHEYDTGWRRGYRQDGDKIVEVEERIVTRPEWERLTQEKATLEARERALREALSEYGQHKPACSVQMRRGFTCACGLDAALASTRRG